MKFSKEFLRKNLINFFSFELFPHRTFNSHILNEYFESIINQIGNEAISFNKSDENRNEFYCFLDDEYESKESLVKVLHLMPE